MALKPFPKIISFHFRALREQAKKIIFQKMFLHFSMYPSPPSTNKNIIFCKVVQGSDRGPPQAAHDRSLLGPQAKMHRIFRKNESLDERNVAL